MATSAISSLFDLACQPRNLQLNKFPSCQLKLATLKSLSFSTNLSHSFFSKGCLSMRKFQRSNHYDVVCMARRYAPNSSLRKKLSRKRGGDREKKNKRRRKRTKKRKGREGKKKKKKEFKIVRLVSTAETGVFYAKKKSRQIKEKLKVRKYDPQLHHHVLFEELK
ncbi:30S ribosomal protein S20, chloroplastic-like [Durio zibethinus]|uniref:50S ribosomal protein L33, chloroplastic n=1 Tax=Durio zibethinus TaxID=66656 RepID=A0A6P5ZNS6_DURZI|nr:30S ribosomal protein S20, chloroplastic-like [Durio zibethinus]